MFEGGAGGSSAGTGSESARVEGTARRTSALTAAQTDRRVKKIVLIEGRQRAWLMVDSGVVVKYPTDPR